jgi:hypothetical protein
MFGNAPLPKPAWRARLGLMRQEGQETEFPATRFQMEFANEVQGANKSGRLFRRNCRQNAAAPAE